jgi:hypothetical protein
MGVEQRIEPNRSNNNNYIMSPFEVAPDLIPDELKERDQWVSWTGTIKEDGKVSKKPHGESDNPRTWGTFDKAVKQHFTFENTGIGFVFSNDDNYCGIDLDGVRDPITEEIRPWAQEVINTVGSYSEVSPSGKGIKIICKAKLPPLSRHQVIVNGEEKIEIYDERRFFTVTGQHLPSTPNIINQAQLAVDGILSRYFPNPAQHGVKLRHEPRETRPLTKTQIDAAAKVIAERMPAEFRNEFCMAAAGYLLRRTDEDSAFAVLDGAWKRADAYVEQKTYGEVQNIVYKSTPQRLFQGTAYGGPKLEERAQGILKALDEILGENIAAKSFNPLGKIISARDLIHKKFKPKEYVIEGNVAVGVGLLAGKPKIGKSWLVLNESIAIASGNRALGELNVNQGRVLYMALEDSQQRLQERLKNALAGDPIPDDLDIVTERSRIGEGFEHYLREYLNQHPDTKYIAIDTLQKIRPKVNGNKGVYAADYQALEPLLPIAAEYGIAIQVVHHLNKMVDPDDPLDAVSGSTGLTGGVDNIRILNRERGTADAFMYVTGRDVEEQKYALKFDPFTTSWVLQGEATEYQMTEARKDIYDALQDERRPLTPNAIAAKIDKSPGAVRERLRHMLSDGQVLANDNNQYYIPTKHDGHDNRDGNDGHDAHDADLSRHASRTYHDEHDGKKAAICRENKPTVTGVMGVTRGEHKNSSINGVPSADDVKDIKYKIVEFIRRYQGHWPELVPELDDYALWRRRLRVDYADCDPSEECVAAALAELRTSKWAALAFFAKPSK